LRFTDIRDDLLPTGQLTIWVPTDETAARAAHAPTDPRRTSHNQEGHIARALARHLDPELQAAVTDPTAAAGRAAPTGWLAVRFDVPPTNEHGLRRAFERWIDRHETLRSGFRQDPAQPGGMAIERFTLPPDWVKLESVELGHHTDPAELADHLEDLFNASTDAVSWPAYVFAAISSAGSTSVILAFNHLNVDGYSMLLMAREVRELVDADREGRPANLPPIASYLDFVEAEREMASQAIASHDAVDQWNTFLGADGTVPVFPLPDGLPPGSQIPQSSCCLPILTEAEAAVFSRWCRQHGVSAGAGFLGAFTLAVNRRRETLADNAEETERFRVLVSTHTRHEAHWAESLGWFTAVAPFDVTLPSGLDLDEVLPTVDDAWARAKRGAALPLARIGELLGQPVEPRFVISYLDARHARGGDRWEAWNSHAYFGDVGPSDEVYAWINRLPTETYLTWRFPGNDVCRTEIEAVTALMAQIIHEIVSTGPAAHRTAEEISKTW